jgi:hypothetical protein
MRMRGTGAPFAGRVGRTIAESTPDWPPPPCRPAAVASASAWPRAGGQGTGTLTINGDACGTMTTKDMFRVLISWSGLDVGRDRGSPVSHYDAPFAFTGRLVRVTVSIAEDQALDGAATARAEMGRQ